MVALAGAGSPASAGTLQIRACADAPDNANNSWAASNTWAGAGKLETSSACGAGGAYGGVYARDELNCTSGCIPPPDEARAGWRFVAPSGTTISSLSYSRWLYKMDDDDWEPALKADDAVLETCAIIYPAYECAVGAQGGSRTVRTIAGASTLDIGIRCKTNPSGVCDHGATLHTVAAVLYGATVTLSDLVTPNVGGLTGSLFAGGYVGGSRTATFDASDNTGIRSARFYVDGEPLDSKTYPCDFTYAVPCANRSGENLSLDTTALADGSRSVQVAVTDPAGNETRSPAQAVTVDNAAPSAPSALTVAGGEAVRYDNNFDVSWRNPDGQTAPIVTARWSICDAPAAVCTTGEATGAGISTLDDLRVPGPGDWSLRVHLEDAAGNADPTRSAFAALPLGRPPASTDPTTGVSTPPADGAAVETSRIDAPIAPVAVGGQPVTGAGVRKTPRLKLTSARVARRVLVLSGRTVAGASGRVRIAYRIGRRLRRLTRTVTGGPFRLALPRPLGARSITVRYLGSAAYTPQTTSRRLA